LNLFRKNWTPSEADEWTVHDLVASILGVLAFFLGTIGVIGAFLFQLWGFVCLVVAGALTILMYRVIDPKLRAMSEAFEEKQQEYLDDLERTVRWESRDGH